MATEAILQLISSPAGADLSAKQFYAITVSGTAAIATAAKNCDGILQNKPTSGQAASVAIFGVSKAVLGTGGVTAGGLMEIASGGTLVALASGSAVAKALETGAAGNVI